MKLSKGSTRDANVAKSVESVRRHVLLSSGNLRSIGRWDHSLRRSPLVDVEVTLFVGHKVDVTGLVPLHP